MLRKVNILTVLAVLCALSYEYIVPYGAVWVYGENYKSLMYECDNAMRDHFIAKKAVEISPNEMNILNLNQPVCTINLLFFRLKINPYSIC